MGIVKVANSIIALIKRFQSCFLGTPAIPKLCSTCCHPATTPPNDLARARAHIKKLAQKHKIAFYSGWSNISRLAPCIIETLPAQFFELFQNQFSDLD